MVPLKTMSEALESPTFSTATEAASWCDSSSPTDTGGEAVDDDAGVEVEEKLRVSQTLACPPRRAVA